MDPLRAAGVHLRAELIIGIGGKQVVIDDPSGNPVELFEPTRTEVRLTNWWNAAHRTSTRHDV